jgi:hypothetical protein
MCILERESILEQNGQGSLALLYCWLLLKVLEVMFLRIPKQYQKILLIATNAWVQESPKSGLRLRSYEGLKLID